jgi:hypothetical protein
MVQNSPWTTNWQSKIQEFPICTQSLLSAFSVFRFQARLQKSEKRPLASTCVSVCLSLCPHGVSRLPLDRMSSNFIPGDFLNVCQWNTSLIKISQKLQLLYMNTLYIYHNNSPKSSYNGTCFVSNKNCKEKQNTHFVCSISSPSKLWLLIRHVGKNGTAGQATDDDVIRRRKYAICMPDNKTRIQTNIVQVLDNI